MTNKRITQAGKDALKQCPDCGATCPDDRVQCLSCGHKF